MTTSFHLANVAFDFGIDNVIRNIKYQSRLLFTSITISDPEPSVNNVKIFADNGISLANDNFHIMKRVIWKKTINESKRYTEITTWAKDNKTGITLHVVIHATTKGINIEMRNFATYTLYWRQIVTLELAPHLLCTQSHHHPGKWGQIIRNDGEALRFVNNEIICTVQSSFSDCHGDNHKWNFSPGTKERFRDIEKVWKVRFDGHNYNTIAIKFASNT